MKTQILSLNLGMNLLDTIIKASKFVFLEVGLNATKLDNIFFQYHLYCFKFGRQFDSDVSNNPRNFRGILKNFTEVGIFFQRHCLKHSLDGHRAVRF